MAALVGTVMGLVWLLLLELPSSVVGVTAVAVGGTPVLDEDTVDDRVDVPWVMENSGDWARIEFRSVASWTRLTRKWSPVGHPPLGGFMGAEPRVPSTKAARIWGWKPVMFWLVRRAVKFCLSLSTRCQVRSCAPWLVHPWEPLGVRTVYAKAEEMNARRNTTERMAVERRVGIRVTSI